MAFAARGGVYEMYWLDSLANYHVLGKFRACFALCFASAHSQTALAIVKAKGLVTL